MHKLSLALYKKKQFRKLIHKFCIKFDGGEFRSVLLREIYKKYHLIDIGLYSYGGCFDHSKIDKFTTFGRYCSVAGDVRIMNRNHPVSRLSTHPYFFNSKLGYCEKDKMDYMPLVIGHDVWIGYSALIIPRVQYIGNGAIIAAGSVVTENVPDFAIVAGNPATIKKYRFCDKKIEQVSVMKWWDKDINELSIELFGEQLPV